VGDRVAIRPILTCGTCRECLSGRPNHCGHRQDLGVWRDGGLAERLVVPASACLKLSDRIPLPVAALTEPLACVLNAVRRIRPAAGERTVVLGAGAIGLLFTAVLTAHGAAPVVVEPSPSRAAAARALGALDVIDPRAYSRPSPADADGKACADGTAGAGAGAGASADTAAGADAAAGADTALGAVVGADIVVDAVGSQFDVAVAMAAPRARIMLFGLNDHSRPAVPQAQITLKELTVLGSFVGQHTFPEAVRLLESGLLDLTPIISHQVDLADLPDLLPALRAGEVIKAVVRIPAE
jgi:threonine dehydrogenase-like Zn-dependent dehydrogenase